MHPIVAIMVGSVKYSSLLKVIQGPTMTTNTEPQMNKNIRIWPIYDHLKAAIPIWNTIFNLKDEVLVPCVEEHGMIFASRTAPKPDADGASGVVLVGVGVVQRRMTMVSF